MVSGYYQADVNNNPAGFKEVSFWLASIYATDAQAAARVDEAKTSLRSHGHGVVEATPCPGVSGQNCSLFSFAGVADPAYWWLIADTLYAGSTLMYYAVWSQGNVVAELALYGIPAGAVQPGPSGFASHYATLLTAATTTINAAAGSPPTDTPTITPTASPTPTPTQVPTSTPTPTLAPTATPTTSPLSFEVVAVRAEKYGSQPDTNLQRAPLKQAKVRAKVYLSIYVLVHSAPPGSIATTDFRLTSAGRVVLHRTRQMTILPIGTAIYRDTTTFQATKPGVYTFRGTVTVNGRVKQRSTTIRVAGAVSQLSVLHVKIVRDPKLLATYVPATIAAHLGQQITWTNDSHATHTVVSRDNVTFDSLEVGPGDPWTLTATKVGTFPYYCI